MKKIFFFWVFVLLAFSPLFNARAGAQVNVTVTTKPAFNQIKPDTDPVKFDVHVYDKQGKPLKNARVALVLKSPERGKFFSTDFPWVENSTLFELRSTLKDGNFSFDYLIPIRGTYTLKAVVSPGDNAEPVEKTYVFKVYENPEEMKKLYFMISVLFSVGFFAGIFFRKSKAALALALVMIAFRPESLFAHKAAHGAMKGKAKRSFAVKEAGRTLSVTLKPDHGVVGKTTRLDAALTDSRGATVKQPVYFEMKIENAEDMLLVFEGMFYAPEGKTSQGIQTTDGANHIVTVSVYDKNPAENKNTLKPLAAFKKEIEVESFAPPKGIVARTLAFLLIFLAAGVLAGSFVEGLRSAKA